MAAWEQRKAELQELGATVYAISVDTLEQSQEVAGLGLTFPIAYGATREDADLIDAWWDEGHGGHFQPAEFLLGRGGVVLGAMYASGPVGRMGVEEAIQLMTSRERRRSERGSSTPI